VTSAVLIIAALERPGVVPLQFSFADAARTERGADPGPGRRRAPGARASSNASARKSPSPATHSACGIHSGTLRALFDREESDQDVAITSQA
jgi:hypothetical protein